jgi:hypothetical protein
MPARLQFDFDARAQRSTGLIGAADQAHRGFGILAPGRGVFGRGPRLRETDKKEGRESEHGMTAIKFHVASLYGRSAQRAIENIVSRPEYVLGKSAATAAFLPHFIAIIEHETDTASSAVSLAKNRLIG